MHGFFGFICHVLQRLTVYLLTDCQPLFCHLMILRRERSFVTLHITVTSYPFVYQGITIPYPKSCKSGDEIYMNVYIPQYGDLQILDVFVVERTLGRYTGCYI